MQRHERSDDLLNERIRDETDVAAAAAVLSPAEAAFLDRAGAAVRELRAARETARAAWVAAGSKLEETRRGAQPVVTEWDLPARSRQMEEARVVLEQAKAAFKATGSRNPELPSLVFLEERYALYMSDVARADAVTAPWEAKLRAAKRTHEAAGTRMETAEWAYEVERSAMEADTGAMLRCRQELMRDPSALHVLFNTADNLAFAHLLRGASCTALRELSIDVRADRAVRSTGSESRVVSLRRSDSDESYLRGTVAVLSAVAHCTALQVLRVGGE